MRRPHRRRTVAALATLVVASATLVGCSDGDDRVRAVAVFDDVADLADGAPVMMLDITIGSVTDIDLDETGRRARISFEVDGSAGVPDDVVARVRRTTPLGEKFIDLDPRTTDADAPLLADGAVVARTEVVSDVEQLVESGTAAFGALSASQLAILLDEGERAFGERGPRLGQVLADVADIVDGYETRTGAVVDIIDDLERLSGDLAPEVGPNAEALVNLNDTLEILNDNDERFFELVRSLNELAADGDRLLTRHLDQIRRQVQGVRDVTDAVAGQQEALGEVLRFTPEHNEVLPQGERGLFVQALLDIVLCGAPLGGDVPGDPVDACYPTTVGSGP